MKTTAKKRPPAAPKKKAPGKSIPDAQRGTEKLQLRVSPIVASLVRDRAKSDGGASAYISRLVVADAALTVRCPKCGAQPGQNCKGWTKAGYQFVGAPQPGMHQLRIKVAAFPSVREAAEALQSSPGLAWQTKYKRLMQALKEAGIEDSDATEELER